MTTQAATRTTPAPSLESAALVTLCLLAAALQVSVAASAWLLTIALGLWATVLVTGRERVEAPPFFLPLAIYAGVTLVSAGASLDPLASLVDAKEILLFLVVPLVYRFARGPRADTVATVIISVGAVTALFGVVQYGILDFDSLGQRPQGSMGHYMTYSGLLMLVLCLAAARVVHGTHDRIWPTMVLPVLAVALTLTLTRSAWVGASVAIGLLLVIRDRRLLAAAPVAVAVVFAVAPPTVADRIYSTFDMQDPTNRDRFAMARIGGRIVSDYPLTGVGPDMVQVVYPEYRDASAVNEVNPHLHNVPLQIAAERGLPALVVWLWFVVVACRDLVRALGSPGSRALAAGGLAAMSAMLSAGLFEYNFGDSEFLMLFLVLITLPLAAQRGGTPLGGNAPV